MAEGAITVEGIQEVMRGFEKYRVAINREASMGLRKAGMEIIADAQVNLRHNTSWVTGLLANSGRVIYGGQDYDVGNLNDARQAKDSATALMSAGASGMDMGLDAGFFDKSVSSDGYAMYVEYGRKAGKMPPPSALEEWVYKKLRVRDRKAARSISWGMAVNIARRGTRPHPFFAPAVEKNKQSIINAIKDAVHKVTR